jgi:hypothetical protein
MKIAFVGDSEYHNQIFDVGYLRTICDTIKYYTFDDAKTIYKDVIGDEFDLIVFPEIFKISKEKNSKLFSMIDEIKKISRIRMLSADVYFPNRSLSIEDEISKRKYMTILTDSAVSGLYNSIDIPMLGVLNFDMLHFNTLNGNPTLKQFIIQQYPEFTNRTYDVMCKLGKAKPLRLLITLLLLKNKLNNSYTNISFSTENSINSSEDIKLQLDHANFNNIIEEYGLYNATKELLIGSYLGSVYSQSKLKFASKLKDYNVDFNSYAEIYTESLTCDLKVIELYPDLVAFTEKTFNNFFDFKIPLPIDTKTNIDYLKKIGFEFPIEPCYIEITDTIDDLYVKINKWMKGLKQYDFKKLWNEWFYSAPFDSPLHTNHKLIVEFMQTRNPKTGLMYSKPQYIATYKLLQKFYPEMVTNYKNWDKQTYLFLRERDLI